MPIPPREKYELGNFMRFIGKFLREPEFRFAVLHKEMSSMNVSGLSDDQFDAVLNLRRGDIVHWLKFEVDELNAEWTAHLDRLQQEVHFPTPPACQEAPAPEMSPLAALSMYTEGKTYLLHHDPPTLPAGTPHDLTIKGLGFAQNTFIAFVRCPEPADPKDVEAADFLVVPTSDVTIDDADLYQRVTVQAPALDQGDWLLYGGNALLDLTNYKLATAVRDMITVV